MITLHKKENDPESDLLEKKLNQLVISFKTKEHIVAEKGVKLPFIEENDKLIQDKPDIEKWLRELESELKWQRSLSGDGCYIDPESGKPC